MRVESNPLFPAAFSSQSRCTVPTKRFVGGSGYGCFTYIPLIWFEDSKTPINKNFDQMLKHFHSRPGY
jgi:hypothetical protein